MQPSCCKVKDTALVISHMEETIKQFLLYFTILTVWGGGSVK